MGKSLETILGDGPASLGSDEGADTRPRIDQPELLEIAVGAVNSVGVDGNLADDIANRRQLVSGEKSSEADRLTDLVDELA
ncbi:MAG TPA: hypothetical protein VND83_09490 [Acidimicrobiales bacterium]|nr:hypothetical protein [Acidimicrobiales bacterium]